LQVNLDAPLPAEVAIGAGTAVFVAGTCFDPEARIRSLALQVGDGPGQAVRALGMPRLDALRSFHPGDDPAGRSYRSGFWGLARIEPGQPATDCQLSLCADLESGARQRVSLGRIPVVAPTRRAAIDPPAPAAGPCVAICLATFDPPDDLLGVQIESLRAQTHENWVCLISDDCSRPDRLAAIRAAIEGDSRFHLDPSPRRLGFYGNFERALSLAPAHCEFVALCDQDDGWYPEKLHTLLAAIGPAQLVYSDARIVDREGSLIAPTYWAQRRNNHTDLVSLLVANSVTGAASLMRRELLDHALPFPPAQFAHYHDHWLGLVALALGGIEYAPRPLYDYVQHGGAALGHARATQITALRERLSRMRADPRERIRVNRTRYFVDVMRLMAFATVLDMRCGSRMASQHRHALRRFLALDRSWTALAGLGWRAVRELSGRPETLGAEWELLQALGWRRLLSLTARPHPQPRLRLDALPPPDLAPRATRPPLAAPGPRQIAEKIAPLELSVSAQAPERVNLLIPTIDLEHFFGGYIAKFNLARRLAKRGARVRLLTVDPVPPLPRDWRARLESYSGLSGLFERVEVGFGRGSGRVEVSRRDRFIATTWWTAHIAQAAAGELGHEGFVYLIQEYEPLTFPMGSFAALAEQSYRFAHFGLFSTELLRGYFRAHGLGAYAGGTASGDARSAAFENAITAIDPPTVESLAARSRRRLLFYARPEPHAARNMFELGVLALQRALEDGAFRAGWDLHGIGTVGARRSLSLGPGAELQLLPRAAQADYADRLREHDIGLALMYTPHPSLVPIEMASAGLVTVTNTFENKTAQALAAISGNLVAAEPTIESLAAALREAGRRAEDLQRRVTGSAVRWSRDWQASFPDELLERLERYLAD
jgi:GT2 family glycosyltransferase